MAKATKRKAARSKSGAAKAKTASTRTAKARTAKPARRAVARKPRPGAKAPAERGTSVAASDATRALARRIIELTTANDDEATFALYAADIESVEMGQPPMHGIQAIRDKFAGWRKMVSDARFEPRRVCVDGNTIVIEWVGQMTLADSGKQAEMHEVAIHEILDGKIVREAFFYNPAALA